MSSIFHLPHTGNAPDFLTIGHVTRDVRADGTFALGGTVTFAALTAHRLGLAAGIVTRADAAWLELLPTRLPNIGLAARTSSETTTFVNTYHEGFRTQFLQARAGELATSDVPEPWQDAPIVLFAPLDQEFTPALLRHFPRRPGSILAATPQGWLRRWDNNGRVWPSPWTAAQEVLPLLDALILSHDDLLPFAEGNRANGDAILTQWSMHVPLLVATDGKHGATLFQRGQKETFPAYQAVENDPTGAGDVFATAFLVNLYRHKDPRQAVDFANCVASLSIEQEGITGIPTWELVHERMKR
ncbi:MAG TPA: PfkB family carbohydrate kinase [Ktedonobacteraceae bacterium]|nr:PfkB family carbohydrate kinase [Ktedonobacteraceae bacterium]